MLKKRQDSQVNDNEESDLTKAIRASNETAAAKDFTKRGCSFGKAGPGSSLAGEHPFEKPVFFRAEAPPEGNHRS